MMTANQLRAARALLDLSQSDVAQGIGASANTISNIEKGTSRPAHDTLTRLQAYFETHGVEFIENEGVRKKPSGIITYRGRDGFAEFIWDVYETVKTYGGEICVSNVDEDLFVETMGHDVDDNYTQKMTELYKKQKFHFKILIKENDYNFSAATYAEYRWVKQDQFHSVPFYTYGTKLAFIIFGENVRVHVIDNTDITESQRLQFNYMWNNASIPKEK